LEKRRKAKNDKRERSGEQKLPADLFTVQNGSIIYRLAAKYSGAGRTTSQSILPALDFRTPARCTGSRTINVLNAQQAVGDGNHPSA